AHARTFCFYEEIEHLIKNNLIKGGSLENAVVIRDDAVLTNEPLRYPDEFVRHKMLDIVGDLSLLGRPVRGHLIAVKPSHAADPGPNAQAAGDRAGLCSAPGGTHNRSRAGGHGRRNQTPEWGHGYPGR